ncbi:MAG: P1 family peptidase [Aliidongia sp.]
MLAPGKLNRITDVEGILVGNAEDVGSRTGTTVILPVQPCVAAVDVRGGAPGTRETDVLTPSNLVQSIHGLVLTGGSAFGLDAASGVTSWLAARGRGFAVGTACVPIVPAVVLFDLLNGGDKDWGDEPPYRALGLAACEAAGQNFTLGNAGAGYGAKARTLKGGLGSASILDGDGLQVGALAAVNPRGSTVMPGEDCFWAWAFEQQNELGGQRPPQQPISLERDLDRLALSYDGPLSTNTTLGVVATNAALTKTEAQRVAIMAQDGFARAIRPVHTPFDGDVVFALATGNWTMLPDEPTGRAEAVLRIGALAADCVARAIARGVYEATALGDLPSYRDRHGRG